MLQRQLVTGNRGREHACDVVLIIIVSAKLNTCLRPVDSYLSSPGWGGSQGIEQGDHTGASLASRRISALRFCVGWQDAGWNVGETSQRSWESSTEVLQWDLTGFLRELNSEMNRRFEAFIRSS